MKSRLERKPKPKKQESDSGDFKVIATNREARHDYEIVKVVEAGIVLTGSEIKSLRAGRVTIAEGYAHPERGEMWLYSVHIPTYKAASYQNHDPDRKRKLLLHRNQIAELAEKVSAQGLTLIPLRIYLKRHRAKVEIGVGKGRKQYDKRQVIAKRDANRRIQQAIRLKA